MKLFKKFNFTDKKKIRLLKKRAKYLNSLHEVSHEPSILIAVKNLVDESYDNNLLFYAIRIDLKLAKIYFSVENRFEEETEWYIEDVPKNIQEALMRISLLQFAYVRKFKEGYYILMAVKGLIGEGSHLIGSYYNAFHHFNPIEKAPDLFTSEIKYLNSKIKTYKYFKMLIKDCNFKDNFYFRSPFMHKRIAPLFRLVFQEYIFGNLDSAYVDHARFFWSKLKPFKKLYESVLELKRDDFKIYSVKKPSEFSIINIWVIYMKMNHFYLEGDSIYFIEGEDKKFIGKLDYLKINIDIIIYYVKTYLYDQAAGFPIEQVVMDYLESAYNKILISPYYYLPNTTEEEICKHIKNLSRLEINYEYQLSKLSFYTKEKEELLNPPINWIEKYKKES